jgi:tetratricopeptide (TPR) repeat protein
MAGILAAVNGILILYDGELYFPTLLVALNLSVFALLLRRRPGRWTDTAAGILLGLAVLVHPVYLLVAAGVALWLMRRHLRRVAPFAIGVVLTILPVTLKNVVARGQLVLVSWNGGINFYVGNQPGYDQRSGMGTEAWDRVFLSLPDAGITREADRDRYYYRLAWRQIAEAPATAVAILLDKMRVFLSPLEISNNFRIYEIREHSPLLAAALGRAGPFYFPFGLWAPLAAIGAVALARRRTPGHGLLLAWALGLALSYVLFFNTARYRAPLVFFGSIWAAATIEECRRLLSERRRKRIATGAAVFLALVAVIAAINREQRSLPPPLEYIEAQALEQIGDLDGAGRLIEEVARRHSEDPGLLCAAALFHLRHGQAAHGRAHVRSVLALPDLSPDDRCNANEILAESYLEESRLEEATRAFDAALAVGVDEATWRGSPYFRLHAGPVTACRLRLGLADAVLRQGRFEQARALIDDVRRECGFHGRIEARRKRLEPLLRAYGAYPAGGP